MLILAEELIDIFNKKEKYTNYEISAIMILVSTYMNNYTFKNEYRNKAYNIIKKIWNTYEFNDDELNNFIRENINMIYISNEYFNYAKHKNLLTGIKKHINLSVDSINTDEFAKDFVDNHLFNEKIIINQLNLEKNKLIVNYIDEYIAKNIQKDNNFVEIFINLFCYFKMDYYKDSFLDEIFTNKESNYRNYYLIIGIYRVSYFQLELNEIYWDLIDDSFKNVLLLFSIYSNNKKIFANDNYSGLIKQHHLEYAFKWKNIDAVQYILNLKLTPNLNCLKNIFVKYVYNDKMNNLLDIYIKNIKITQEQFIFILENTIPPSIPQDIIFTDDIIDLYSKKDFCLITQSICNLPIKKTILEKIITKKINDNNFTPTEIKHIYDTLNELKIILENINHNNIEKIGNKNIRKNILKFIK